MRFGRNNETLKYTTMRLLLLALALLCMALTCTQEEENCHTISHELTNAEIEWFSIDTGDTLWFQDKNSGESYYLICASNETGKDEHKSLTDRCPSGVRVNEYYYLKNVLNSNLPFFNNNPMNLLLYLESVDENLSIVTFDFIHVGENSSKYFYITFFDTEEESLKTHHSYQAFPWHIDSMSINNRTYSDVFRIEYVERTPSSPISFYDTLYYNRDGFLKFISSRYGYRLERVE
jgi:hypothetical protein